MNSTRINICFAIVATGLLVSLLVWSHFYQNNDQPVRDEAYNTYVENLKQTSAKLKPGMTRKEVERLIVPPDDFSFDDSTGRTVWHWNAGKHLSSGSEHINFSETKGFFMVSVVFSKDGRIEKISSGVN